MLGGEKLRAVRAVVDRENRHAPDKLSAAMKLLGLEPEDIIPPPSVTVSAKIPDAERADKIRQKKQEALARLREDRVKRLLQYLSTMTDAEATRYGRFVGDGVCAVRPEDLPDEQVLGNSSSEDLFAASRRQMAQLDAEQQRKAKSVALGFLQQKQRSEDADMKVDELEKRMAAFKKEQKDRIKVVKKEAQAKMEKCQANVAKADQDREEREDAMMQKLEEMQAAASERRAGRDKGSSGEQLAAKIAAAEQTRRAAFMRAADMERRAIQRIEEKANAVDQRLWESLEMQREAFERRSQEQQEKFQRRQLSLINAREEWAEAKFKEHSEFENKHNNAHQTNKDLVKARAKSCSDLIRKRQEQARAINERLRQEKSNADDNFTERHAKADQRAKSLAALGCKCDIDVHSHIEAKAIQKEIQTSRRKEVLRKELADRQALLVKLAEDRKRADLIGKDNGALWRRRQQVQKDTLTQRDVAFEGFLKIQSSSNEEKIKTVMASLGFEMPTLVDEKSEEEDEQAQKAKTSK